MNIFSQLYDLFYQPCFYFSNKIFVALIKTDYYVLIPSGLAVSLQITFSAALIGVVLGILIAICKMQKKGIFLTLANAYVSVIRGTPVVVQLCILYYIVFKNNNSGLFVPSLAFGLNSAAYVSEIIRSGIQSVDRGQMEAGRSLGLNYYKTMKNIILPQAIKNVLPALGNEFIVLLKETSIAGYVGVTDINKAGSKIISATYDGMIALIIVAYIYFIMTTTLAAGINRFEGMLKKSD